MKTIVEGNERIIKLLGKQSRKKIEYRVMKYTVSSEYNSGLLLYNVLTGKLVLLNEDESKSYKSLPSTETDFLNELIENYFVVPERFDELFLVKRIRELAKKLFVPAGINNYVIFTTTECNARCFYCFESDNKRITMNASTCDRLVEHIINHKGPGPIQLRWFGGEPLIGIESINRICNELKIREIEFGSFMVSNGYLFNEQVVHKAVDLWALKEVQITLDGTEYIYNKTKAYVGVKGSPYKTVLNNIELLLSNGIRVIVRINLDQNNMNDLYCLADELKQRFDCNELLQVYVYVVEKDLGYNPIKRNEKEELELYREQQRLNKYLDQLGFIKKAPGLSSIRISRCMADDMRTLAIYPDGRIYKCEHVTEDDWIGSIYTDSINTELARKYEEVMENEECTECPLFPSCIRLNKCPVSGEYNSFTCDYRIKSIIHEIIGHTDTYFSMTVS